MAKPAFQRAKTVGSTKRLADDTPKIGPNQAQKTVPALIAAGRPVGVYNTPEYLRDVGTAKRHGMAEADLASGRVARESLRHARPAIFFDVDGVLNEEPGGHGVLSEDQVVLLPGAAEAVGFSVHPNGTRRTPWVPRAHLSKATRC